MTPEQWDRLSDELTLAIESGDPEGYSARDPELAALVRAWRESERLLSEPPRDPLAGRQILGRYTLTMAIGRGGTGTVYLAEDSHIAGRRVVVKILHDFWSAEDWMRRKFREEARVLAQLDHPAIVSLLDAGETEDGRLFLLMPYREGRTLRQALTHGPAETSAAAAWIARMGEAVAHAHRRGILHRDLKPENVLLTAHDGGESPMLLDFGIAQLGDPAGSRTTTHLMGSAFYMAPEHLLGHPERASDIYSLAVIAWEMLTGEHPFATESPFALPEKQRQGVGDAFYRLRPDLGLGAGRLLTTALDANPKRRPQDAGEFCLALSEAIVKETKDSRLTRLWALRRSRRWMLAGGAAALAGSGFVGWQLRDRLNPLAPEERVIEFIGGKSIEMNGFSRLFDMDGEFGAWAGPEVGYTKCRYRTRTQGQAAKSLTIRQKRAAFRHGWRLSSELQVEEGFGGILLDSGTFAPRFDLGLWFTPKGSRAMSYTRIQQGLEGPWISMDPQSMQKLVELNLHYDPKTRSARATADGREVVRSYFGHFEYREDNGIDLFVTAGDSQRGIAIFGDARFEILDG